MGERHEISVLLTIRTDDPRLNPERVIKAAPEQADAIREAAMENLHRVDRINAIMPVPAARVMLRAFIEAAPSIGGRIIRNPPKETAV